MATETILVNFKARGDQKLIKSMHALAQAQGRLEKNAKSAATATTFLGTSFNRNAKGASAFSLSLSTLRSKMLLVSFGLGLVANGLSRTLASMAKSSQQLNQMERAFDNLIGGAESSSIALSKLSLATNGTVSDFELLQQANNAMILGVSKNSDEMAEMFDIAQRLGKALGVDTTRSIESLVTGIGRQSRLMLDNIGIIVRSDEAYESYAKQLGKSKDELTDFEKKQAFFNATMESARKKVAAIGEETDEGDAFQKLSASTDNFSTALGEALAPALESAAEGLSSMIDGAVDLLEAFDLIDTALEKAIQGFTDEKVANQVLRNELNKTTEGTEDYFKVKEKIIARFPNYFDTIKNEEIGMDNLNQALNDHNKFLSQKIKIEIQNELLMAKKEQLTNAIAASIERENRLAEIQVFKQAQLTQLFTHLGGTLGHTGEALDKYIATQMASAEAQDFLNTKFDQTADTFTTFEEAFKERGFLGLDKMFRDNLTKVVDNLKSSGVMMAETEEDVQSIIDKITEALGKEQEVINQFFEELSLFGDVFDGTSNSTENFTEEITKMSDEVSQAQKDINSIAQATTSFLLSSQQGARTFKAFGDVVVQQIERILATFLANFATFKLMSLFFGGNFTDFAKAPTLFGQTMQQLLSRGASSGFGVDTSSLDGVSPASGLFHNGGMIQSYHKGGNVPIMAQEGEFVMRRSAVESIGIENLSRMNRTGQSGVNINFTGNVLSKNFIESEAIPMIKKAIRKGATLGKA